MVLNKIQWCVSTLGVKRLSQGQAQGINFEVGGEGERELLDNTRKHPDVRVTTGTSPEKLLTFSKQM